LDDADAGRRSGTPGYPERMRRARLSVIARADLPRASRLRLLGIEVAANGLRRRGGTAVRSVRVPVGASVAERLRGSSLLVDYWTFCDIFVDHCFLFEERDAVVVDAGAHCGYFGAYALVGERTPCTRWSHSVTTFTELQRSQTRIGPCSSRRVRAW
jgi:hypothetical protein